MNTISNNEIKKIRSLQQKKFRDESGLFVVEGEKMVQEALSSEYKIEAIYRRDEIGEDVMKRISSMSTPSPVLAVLRKPESVYASEDEYPSLFGKNGLYLGLDAVRDPGNLGTILRIADWFGIDSVFASSDTVDVFNPKTVQSTMGAIFRVRIHYVDLPLFTRHFLDTGGRVYGTFLDGENMYSKDLSTGKDCHTMIVVGNESEGISDEMDRLVSDRLYIPPYPQDVTGSESLNVAIATAVTVSEFRRRLL